MLTIAISAFFALAFFGASMTIVMMFHSYKHKIKAVIEAEFQGMGSGAETPVPAIRVSNVRTFPVRHRLPVAPLRAAA